MIQKTAPEQTGAVFLLYIANWNVPKFVRTVRKRIGRFDELGAERLFEALLQYEQQFGEFRKKHARVEAHRLAIETVQESLAENMEG